MSEVTKLDKSDRVGLYMSVAFAVVGIGFVVARMIDRLVEVAPGHDIPVLIPLSGEKAALPLGPDGAAVSADILTATIIVADPAPATLFALWAQPIVFGLAWSIGLVIAAMFCVRLARAQAFTRGTYRLTYWAAGVLTFGWCAGSTLTHMTTNGALSAVSNYTYDAVIFQQGFAPLVGVLLIAAMGVALQAGERLQRETEGLV